MKKYLALVMTLFVLCGCSAKQINDEKNNPSHSPRGQVTVTVTGFEGEELLQESVEYETDMTVLSALETATEGNFKTDVVGGYVTEIMGLAEKEHGAFSGWMYNVNGEEPTTGAQKYILKNGDSVEWTYFAE